MDFDEYEAERLRQEELENEEPETSLTDDLKEEAKSRLKEKGKEKIKNEFTKRTQENAAKRVGQEGAKKVGQEAVKKTGEQVVKKAGQEVAKKGATMAAEKGAEAAVGATGVGLIAVAAIEGAKLLSKVKKMKAKAEDAAAEKVENITGIDKNVTKKINKHKKLILLLFFILAPFFLFMTAGAMFLASEDTYTDIYSIIQKREARYGKPLIRMIGDGITYWGTTWNDDIAKILTKDEKRDDPDKDISIATYLKEQTNNEFQEYIPVKVSNPADEYKAQLDVIRQYLLAGRENFNSINWTLVGGNTTNVDLEAVDDLNIPKVSKYNQNDNITADQSLTSYLDMLNLYLQHWVVPFALNVATQDTDFGMDVLKNMKDPINISLYQLDRLTKTTTTYYYLKTDVTERVYSCTYDEYGFLTSRTLVNTLHYESDTSVSYHNSDTNEYDVTLQQVYGTGEYIRAGVKSGPSIDRKTVPYRYVPEITYAEGIYNIIKAAYKIDPIDESTAPVSKDVVLDSSGKEVITEKWDENVEQTQNEIKTYKLSYLKPEDYDSSGNRVGGTPITRVEWWMDFGGGTNEMYPSKAEPNPSDAFEVSRINFYKSKYDMKAGQTLLDAVKEKYYTNPRKTDEEIKALKAAGVQVITGYSEIDMDMGLTQIQKYYNELKQQMLDRLGGGVVDLSSIPPDGFAWPVEITPDNPDTAVINCIFPYTPAYGSFHGGIDVSRGRNDLVTKSGGLSVGPNIVAACDGTITALSMTATEDSVYSNGTFTKLTPYNYIEITTPDGRYVTQYGHLSLLAVNASTGQKFKIGDTVQRGQIIGKMGTTGKSTGVHLHFAIKDNGQLVDPLNYYITTPDYGSISPNSITHLPSGYRYIGSKTAGLTNTLPTGAFPQDVSIFKDDTWFEQVYWPTVSTKTNKNIIKFYYPYAVAGYKATGTLPSTFISQLIGEGGWTNAQGGIDIINGTKTYNTVTTAGAGSMFGMRNSSSPNGFYSLKYADFPPVVQMSAYCKNVTTNSAYAVGQSIAKRSVGTVAQYTQRAKDVVQANAKSYLIGPNAPDTPENIAAVNEYSSGLKSYIDNYSLGLLDKFAAESTVQLPTTTANGQYKAYRQGDQYWGSLIYAGGDTWTQSACGPTSVAVILTELNKTIPGYDGITRTEYKNGVGNISVTSPKDGVMDPFEVGVYCDEHGGHTAGGAMYHTFPTLVFHDVLGMNEVKPTSASAVLNYLKQGYVGVASTSSGNNSDGFFTDGGHIVAVVGYSGDKIHIVDVSNGARDGYYTVSQMDSQTQMPNISAAKGPYARVAAWFLYKK